MRAERARQIDEMTGVGGAAGAELEDDVVAGVFAFAAQARAGDPEQRVEPVDGAQHFGGQLNQPVAANQVRHLVREHELNAIRRPRRAASSAAGSPARSRPRSRASPDAASRQCEPGRRIPSRRRTSSAAALPLRRRRQMRASVSHVSHAAPISRIARLTIAPATQARYAIAIQSTPEPQSRTSAAARKVERDSVSTVGRSSRLPESSSWTRGICQAGIDLIHRRLRRGQRQRRHQHPVPQRRRLLSEHATRGEADRQHQRRAQHRFEDEAHFDSSALRLRHDLGDAIELFVAETAAVGTEQRRDHLLRRAVEERVHHVLERRLADHAARHHRQVDVLQCPLLRGGRGPWTPARAVGSAPWNRSGSPGSAFIRSAAVARPS